MEQGETPRQRSTLDVVYTLKDLLVLVIAVGLVLVVKWFLKHTRDIGALFEHLARATGSPLLAFLDLRALSVGSFGIALYLTMLIRGRSDAPSGLAGRHN